MKYLPNRKLSLVLSSLVLGIVVLFFSVFNFSPILADSNGPTATITPIDTNTDQITVTFTNPVPQGNIADFELYDINNQKVWQQFSTDGGTSFTKTAQVANGTYQLKVGLFTPGWGSNYAWFNNVLSITVPNTNITPTVTMSITPTATVSPTLTLSVTPSLSPTIMPSTTQTSQATVTNATAMAAYTSWKAQYVKNVDNGAVRVVRPENNNDTVSEGMGYGMLLAEMAGDQQTFGNMLAYVVRYLDGKGLMNWDINSSGSVIGQGSATDADEDIAFALVEASKKWPNAGYDTAARNIIQSMMNTEVMGTNNMNPGDNWGNTQTVNPSYLASGYYASFAQLSGNSRWNDIESTTSNWLTRSANGSTGLVPDWVNNDLSPASISFDQHTHDFYYDALRNPIRMLFAYKLTNNQNAKALLQKQNTFFSGVGADKLKSGYTLSGSPLTSYLDTAFLSAYAASGQIDPQSGYAKDSMNSLVTKAPSGYFGTTLRALTLFISAI